MSSVPVIAVSRCLLGELVRYDGRRKPIPPEVAALVGEVQWVPFCPEVEAGMAVPRPPIELVGDHRGCQGRVRVVEVDSRRDHTAALMAAVDSIIQRIEDSGARVAWCKARSPSCGVDDVPVSLPDGSMEVGSGVLVAALRERLSDLEIVRVGA